MRKGITPIIAIIVLLLITVALAGAAWTYLSGYLGGLTGKSVEIRDYFCVGANNNNPTIIVANTGTLSLSTSEISIIYTTTGVQPNGRWSFINGTYGLTEIPANGLAKWNSTAITCSPSCTFRVVAGTAKAQIANIVCG
jgi:flagellin-like protein